MLREDEQQSAEEVYKLAVRYGREYRKFDKLVKKKTANGELILRNCLLPGTILPQQ